MPLNLVYLRDLIAEKDAGRVLKSIRRLMIVSVSLSPGQDNPQLIFESLNSTGVKLAQADLVRNYVLMGHPEQVQTDWYLKYWRPLEEAGMPGGCSWRPRRQPRTSPKRLVRSCRKFRRRRRTFPNRSVCT